MLTLTSIEKYDDKRAKMIKKNIRTKMRSNLKTQRKGGD